MKITDATSNQSIPSFFQVTPNTGSKASQINCPNSVSPTPPIPTRPPCFAHILEQTGKCKHMTWTAQLSASWPSESSQALSSPLTSLLVLEGGRISQGGERVPSIF